MKALSFYFFLSSFSSLSNLYCSSTRSFGSPNLKVLTHISKASIIKCLTNKWHFLSEDKSFYTIYTNLYSNPPKNYTNL